MRIYTRSGDLAFKTFTFPDGQPHFKLETYEQDFEEVTIETAIKSTDQLFMVLLCADVLRQHGYSRINLDIRYLLAARMDRAIDWSQPCTLSVVARLINGAGFTRVRILDAHSETATRLIRNSTNILPWDVVDQVRTTIGPHIVIAPDKGAVNRVSKLVMSRIVCCSKKRDIETGTLSGFEVSDQSYVKNNHVLIVDDICDGGGTFVGLASELRKAGAKTVNLFVTHGIFSKGLEALYNIDKVFTTDSYCQYGPNRPLGPDKKCVVIPISMEKL